MILYSDLKDAAESIPLKEGLDYEIYTSAWVSENGFPEKPDGEWKTSDGEWLMAAADAACYIGISNEGARKIIEWMSGK